jgi:AcrR family transcriptional regulator
MPDDRPPGRRAQTTLATKRRLQAVALRLFTERGYEATTVADVAREAGVAERTCFRHFPTKPDLVLWDSDDDRLLERFREQPARYRVLDAFRRAVREGAEGLSSDERAVQRQRSALTVAVPELRAAHLDHFVVAAHTLAGVVAARASRAEGDPDVRAVTGAVIGITMTAELSGGTPAAVAAAIDDGLARLARGLADL